MALHLLTRMATPPSTAAYLSLLKACCKSKALFRVQHVYAHLQHHSRLLSSHGNQVVAALAGCGGIQEACDLAWTLRYRTVLSWTAIISAYTASGHAEEALGMYECMQLDGVEANTYTFLCLFQACGILENLEQGMRLHAIAHFRCFTSSVYVGSTLVSMYGKLGFLMDAEQAFLMISNHNTVSWSAMLAGYSEQGKCQKALLLYRQMKQEGWLADEKTFSSVLDACGGFAKSEESPYVHGISAKAKSLEITRAFHADAKKLGLAFDIFVSSTLVSTYGKCGAIIDAVHVFKSMPHRNLVSWCAMLSAHVDNCQGEKALWLYKEAMYERISSEQVMFVIAFQACSALAEENGLVIKDTSRKASLEIGRALHTDARKKGYASVSQVGNTLIRMYGKCGAIEEAERAFTELVQHNVVSFNALLSAFVEQNQEDKALCLYCHMHEQNVVLDSVAHICILQAAGAMGDIEIVQDIHFGVVGSGLEDVSSLAATLIHAYGNCGHVKDGEAFFLELPKPHMGSWNACISAHAREGSLVVSISYVQQLKFAAVEPDSVALTSVLSCYSHAGVVMEGLDLFSVMWVDYGVAANLKHYGALLDLLGRAGLLWWLKDILRKMPMEADVSIWLCVLNACRRHGNKELADYVFDRAAGFKDGTVYVLMSNVYVETLPEEHAADMD